MTNEEKNTVRAQVNAAAAQGAQKAAEAAKTATGWKKWLLVALAAALAAVALFTQVQCTGLTPTQVRTVREVHTLFHALTDEQCMFEVEEWKK
jgi:hypothetical protein